MTKLQELEKQLQNLQSEIEKLKQAEQNGNQWVPEVNEMYGFIDDVGEIRCTGWGNGELDTDRLSIGNVFRTEEEAEFEVERLKVIAELKKYTSEFVYGGDNCQITFDYEDDGFIYVLNDFLKSPTLYFPSEEIARRAVWEVGEDRVKKYYLGVSE